jgi:hypothetical protein
MYVNYLLILVRDILFANVFIFKGYIVGINQIPIHGKTRINFGDFLNLNDFKLSEATTHRRQAGTITKQLVCKTSFWFLVSSHNL